MSRSSGSVLVVDDLETNRRLLERMLVADGFVVITAAHGEEALALMAEVGPDVVLMDVRMPRRDGFSTCEALKSSPAWRLVPVVLMTGSAEREDRVRAIEAGADDFLTKPVDPQELKARVRSLVRMKRYTDELDSAESVIMGLARTVEARDPYTEGHCERLARYAVAVGRRLGLPADDLEALYRGGFLHDIGKIAVPDAVLAKRGPLTQDEFAVMKTHAAIGEQLLGSFRPLARVRPIVRHHHEKIDGSGYPDGLVGDAIPHLAQIVGVVDVYDALTTDRPYRTAGPRSEALEELGREVARGWRDPVIVEALAAELQGRD